MGKILRGGNVDGNLYQHKPALGLDFINAPTNFFKSGFQNTGQRGLSCSKIVSYLAYRVVSYSFIPAILNAIAAVVSAILGISTLPIRLCSTEINQRCWNQLQFSGARLIDNLTTDLFYDLSHVAKFAWNILRCCTKCVPEPEEP